MVKTKIIHSPISNKYNIYYRAYLDGVSIEYYMNNFLIFLTAIFQISFLCNLYAISGYYFLPFIILIQLICDYYLLTTWKKYNKVSFTDFEEAKKVEQQVTVYYDVKKVVATKRY